MHTDIKQIEDMSLNAWPSHKMELYDGWILRFSYFYTHRTNSVEQFGASTLTWREKIPYCEQEYSRLGSPAVFKISPLVSPDFDYVLENRGYAIEHTTDVMTMELREIPPKKTSPRICYTEDIPEIWIHSLFDLKGTINPVHRAVVPSMYRAIPKETICASIWHEGKIVSTGLGILDRDSIGIYAIHVREDFRRKGYARQICTGLLREGQKKGARKAYLQVVENNLPAHLLYESLGFRKYYTYWFRVQPASTAAGLKDCPTANRTNEAFQDSHN
ncbi:MAG: GNAT family N-acetyltransferase [Clostridiales bacterium]|nr:GNAT family N-acetyltransferase [Clostridiales bacterium]